MKAVMNLLNYPGHSKLVIATKNLAQSGIVAVASSCRKRHCTCCILNWESFAHTCTSTFLVWSVEAVVVWFVDGRNSEGTGML